MSTPPADEVAAVLGSADIIIVSGGNTQYAIDRFHAAGAVPLLREAMDRGAVPASGSGKWWMDGLWSPRPRTRAR